VRLLSVCPSDRRGGQPCGRAPRRSVPFLVRCQLPAAGPPARSSNVRGWREADLVFDPTLACRGSGHRPPAAAPEGSARSEGTDGGVVPSPPDPDRRGRGGQGLLL